MRIRYASAYQAIGIVLTLSCLTAAAGCSGGGSAGSAPNSLVPQVPLPSESQPSQTPFSGSDSAISLDGRVTTILSSTEFSYETGYPHGHVPVLYSESMVVPSNASLRVGQSVTVKGSFNKLDKLIATKVTVESTSPSPTPTPTPTSTPAPTGRLHIATFAYDDVNGPGENASTASVNLYLSYAQGNGKALSDCHSGSQSCKAVFYVDPNHSYNNSPSSCMSHPDGDVVGAASESWFVHNTGSSDSAHRVYGKSSDGCRIWEMNPKSGGFQKWWQNYLVSHADNYDLYLLDNDPMDIPDAGYFPSGGGCNPWPSICNSTEEISNNTAEVSARASFVNAMNHSDGKPMHFFYQQSSFNTTLDLSAFSASNRFVGFTCEGCISTYAFPARSTFYERVLNEMAAVNSSPGAYLLISHGNASAGSATQILQRLVTTGIIWLAYSEGHTIVQPDLESNTNNLAVWPEDLIYPSEPLQSMTSGANDLKVASGVWRREFKSCFQGGRSFGKCAVVVNSTGSSLVVRSSWLSQTYKHVVKLSGGDVLAGGSATLDATPFTANSTTIQTGGALLLAP